MRSTFRLVRYVLPALVFAALCVPGRVLADPAAAAPQPAPAATPAPPATATPATYDTVMPILPGTSAILLGIDTHWLWQATAPARTEKPLASKYEAMQWLLNVSAPSDIFPWLGRTYFGFLPGATATASPIPIFYAEITDQNAFASAASRMGTEVAVRSHLKISTSTFDGHTVTHIVPPGNTGTYFVFMQVGNWLVGSSDGQALHTVADVLDGKVPSMAANDTFFKNFAAVESTKPAIYGVMWQQAFMKMGGAADPDTAAALKSIPTPDITVFAMNDNTTSLKMTTENFYSGNAQTLNAALCQKARPITGDSFNHIPNSTFMSTVFSNPSVWVDMIRPIFQAMKHAMGAAAGPGFDPMGVIDSFQPVLNLVTGEVNLAICYSDSGPGVVGVFQTDSSDSAKQALTSLVGVLSNYKIQLQQKGDSYILPGQTADSAQMFSPIFGTDGPYLTAALATHWLSDPKGSPSVSLPPQAAGAQTLCVGNLKWLNPMISSLTNGLPDSVVAKTPFPAIQKAGVPNATWMAWGTIAPDGSTDSSTFELDNVDWKAAIFNAILPAMMNMMPTSASH